jgi:hypothetical protein
MSSHIHIYIHFPVYLDLHTVPFQSVQRGVWPMTLASKIANSDRPLVTCNLRKSSHKFQTKKVRWLVPDGCSNTSVPRLWPHLEPIQTAPLWHVTSKKFWKFLSSVTYDIQIDWNVTVYSSLYYTYHLEHLSLYSLILLFYPSSYSYSL